MIVFEKKIPENWIKSVGKFEKILRPKKAFCLKKSRAVYDMIYQPNQTPLLTAAKEAGCKYANGLGMLLHQGAKSLEIWSGQSAPLESMREALKKAINHG